MQTPNKTTNLRLTLTPELNKFIEDCQANRLRAGNKASKEKIVLELLSTVSEASKSN